MEERNIEILHSGLRPRYVSEEERVIYREMFGDYKMQAIYPQNSVINEAPNEQWILVVGKNVRHLVSTAINAEPSLVIFVQGYIMETDIGIAGLLRAYSKDGFRAMLDEMFTQLQERSAKLAKVYLGKFDVRVEDISGLGLEQIKERISTYPDIYQMGSWCAIHQVDMDLDIQAKTMRPVNWRPLESVRDDKDNNLREYALPVSKEAQEEVTREFSKNGEKGRLLHRFSVCDANQTPNCSVNLNVYVAFLRDCPRSITTPDRWGNFTDLEWLFEYVKDLGFNSVLLMPFTQPVDPTSTDGSPYTQVSPYIIDPRHIDWKRVPYTGETPQEKFASFIKSEQNGYMQFEKRAFIREYAEFERTKGLDDSQIEFLVFEQFICRRQLMKALDYAHELDLSVVYDQPFFRAIEGLDVAMHPEYFIRDVHRKVEWAIYQKPGEKKPQQEWPTLAVYDLEALKSDNYRFYIAPVKYFIEELGFSGVRLDALHYGYTKGQGLYEAIGEALKGTGALIISENLGSFDPEEVDGKSLSLGFMPYANPGFCMDSLRNLIECIKGYNRYFCVSSTHDTERIPDFYRDVFAPNTSDRVIAIFIHTIYALLSHAFVILLGDEYISNYRINTPGVVHPWKCPAFRNNPRSDIRTHIQRLNLLRSRNRFLTNPDLRNEHSTRCNYGRDKEYEVVAYTVSSPERKQHIIVIANLSGSIRAGRAYIEIDKLGVNIEKRFELYDPIEDRDYGFEPSENVYEDGSVFYKLAPYQIHVWEYNATSVRHKSTQQ